MAASIADEPDSGENERVILSVDDLFDRVPALVVNHGERLVPVAIFCLDIACSTRGCSMTGPGIMSNGLFAIWGPFQVCV